MLDNRYGDNSMGDTNYNKEIGARGEVLLKIKKAIKTSVDYF